MIETLNSNQTSNSFVDLKELEKELSQNPFGKILVYKKENRIIAYLYYSEIYERVEINDIEVEEQ